LEIYVSDSGPGVDPEFPRPHLRPLFLNKPNGVGLGLTIAGEIASEYYGGALELMEQGPLPGATFGSHCEAYLMAVDPPWRILAVDDESEVLRQIQEFLSDEEVTSSFEP
jgi:hypothetical protein